MAQLVTIFCERSNKSRLAACGNKLMLARVDPSDKTQEWVKDYSKSGGILDEQGQRAFTLVNNGTGKALVIKNFVPETGITPVSFAPYNVDEGVNIAMLWTESKELAGGFREVRPLKAIYKTLNVVLGDVDGGATVSLFPSEPQTKHAVWKMNTIKTIDPPTTAPPTTVPLVPAPY